MSTVYFTTASSNTVYFNAGSGNTVYFTTTGSGNIVIPYASYPSVTAGDDIVAWIESKHGVDPNGDGAYDIGVVTVNTQSVDVNPISNDTADFDTWAIYQPPNNGAAVVTGNNIQYTPSAGYVGFDSIGYSLIKDGVPIAMATVYVGIYGAQPPTVTLPSYDTIPAISAFMDQSTEISLSQFTNIGTVQYTHRLKQALDVGATVTGSLLTLTPDSNLHGVGVGKVIIELVSQDGLTVYDTKIITINKLLDTSYVDALITLEINDVKVDEWRVDGYAPEQLVRQINGSYTGIQHNNEPVKVVVYVQRLDGNQTVVKTTIIGSVVIKEIV